MPGWLAVPREWLSSLGEIAGFCGKTMALVYTGRVFYFFGEALRQAGILILGSTIVIWGLVFILGLQCGIEGAYFNRTLGAPSYAGVFAAWCDLREVVPYAFGYMMAAKVGTGIVAELGAMRISDEIDALEVMGVPPMTFLAATRLLGAWLTLPFMYLTAIGIGYFASYLAVVQQIGDVSSGGYFLIFWMFQNPPDVLFSLIKAMFMATAIVLVGCYYGYTASGGPVGVGTATAKSMVLNIVLVHVIGMMGTLVFWGANPRAPIGGVTARVEIARRGTGRRPLHWLAPVMLLILMGVGSLVLWIGIPIGVLFALSRLTESSTHHFVAALIAVPAAMLLFAPALLWLNRLYLRLTGPLRGDDDDRRQRLGGPLELFLYASMAIAFAALVAWILFVGERPPYTVW